MENKNKLRIKIGFLLHGLAYGGAPWSLYILLKYLDREKYEIFLYTISSSSDEIKNEFIKIIDHFRFVSLKPLSINQVHSDSFLKYFIRVNSNISSFINILNKDKIEVLHINTSVFPHVSYKVKKYTNVKLITHLREWIPSPEESWLAKYMIKCISVSDALIAISDNESKYFLNHPNIRVLPNPFDFEIIKNIIPKFRKDKKISDNTVLICMLGQFHYHKGHLDFIESLSNLLKLGVEFDFKFVILGIKPLPPTWKRIIKKILLIKDYRNKIFKKIEQKSLNKYIELIPFTKNVLNYLIDMDIVVRPAITGDPWGRDIIEGMALKKPVIATGQSEFYIKNGITGFLIPPKYPDILAEKLKILIQSFELRTRMGRAGYQRIRRMCDSKVYLKNITSIYQNIPK